MVWLFLLGLSFCILGLYFFIDFIKNKKEIYDLYSEEEGIPVSFYRQIIAAILGVLIGTYFILKSFGL